MSDSSAYQDVFAEWENQIGSFDHDARERAQAKWNAVAKPIGSLGVLEDAVMQIAGITGSEDVDISKRVLVVMCADNGVIVQGVSQSGTDVTRAVTTALGAGTSSACVMAHTAHVDVVPVDIGMADPDNPFAQDGGTSFDASVSAASRDLPGVVNCSVGLGTSDISLGPAMTREQAVQALRAGVEMAGAMKERGYRLIATGEMSIGNTTTASSIVAALFDRPASEVVGRGAGLSNEALAVKVQVVEKALRVNGCTAADPLGVLACLGGFDIAGMAGLFIGGAIHRMPVVVDGFISAVAAYIATLLVPSCAHVIMGSHVSSEPAVQLVLSELAKNCEAAGVSFKPVIDAGMRLGEGTGAVCLVPLLDAALALYNGTTFNDEGITPYEVLPR